MDEQLNYSQWDNEQLIERVTFLEQQLKDQTSRYNSERSKPWSANPKPRNARIQREIDPRKYSTRFIALKFAYLGQNYNGLEYSPNNETPLPTIEEELWKALNKARLIFPAPAPTSENGNFSWDGCDYSKCGRTDKGVSAFGQVVGIRIRSNQPKRNPPMEHDLDLSPSLDSSSQDDRNFHPIKDEIPYPKILNRILPPDIRILAWCPFPPEGFSARFSCVQRCYKYYFTQPAFTPTVGAGGLLHSGASKKQQREGWLNIEAMREAAQKFRGSHDFRNFCKVDPSKQIENFTRSVHHVAITEVHPHQSHIGYLDLSDFQQFSPPQSRSQLVVNPNQHHDSDNTSAQSNPKIYAFEVRGSGFLWHQVRHMAAILFLIGQELEQPNLIDTLLNVQEMPRKPSYEMADDAPLVLQDCRFEPELEWIHVGDTAGYRDGALVVPRYKDGKHGLGGVVDELWKLWRKSKMDEILAGSLLDLVVRGNDSSGRQEEKQEQVLPPAKHSQKVFVGGNGPRMAGNYIPVLEKPRNDPVEVINARYAKRKGLAPRNNPPQPSEIDSDDHGGGMEGLEHNPADNQSFSTRVASI